MAEFNQIPTQCRDKCELTQEDVDKHGIVVSLNCDGPSYKSEEYKDSVKVRQGEVVDVDLTGGHCVGRVACTDLGVNLWMKDRVQSFQQAGATDNS